MTINSLQLNSSTPWTGLGTATYTATTTGLYTCAVVMTLPYVAAGSADTSTTAATDPAASALSILIKNNGTTVASVSSPSPTQPQMNVSAVMQVTAGNAITVVLSSSAASDAAPNAVKGTINIYSGE